MANDITMDSPSGEGARAWDAKRIAVWAAWILSAVGLGAVGGLATSSSVDSWYLSIQKPSWTPPGWLFAPVWTTLYIAMGVAAALIWDRTGWSHGRRPLIAYGVQLALNVAWSFLFFGARSPGWALVEIVVLWAAILTTLLLFWRVRRLAGALFIPYLAWVSFATALNAAIWWLNR
jgi:translocator protein